MSYSETRQSHIVTAIIIALAGSATWAAMDFAQRPFRVNEDLLQMLRVTALAAGIGGLATAPLFGHPGAAGFARTLFGAIFSTLIGSTLAAIWMVGFEGVIFGPLYVFSAIATNPFVTCVWVGIMAAAHAYASCNVSPESSGSP